MTALLFRLRVAIRDWWRGYSDADRESYLRKTAPGRYPPGSIVRVTRRELRSQYP